MLVNRTFERQKWFSWFILAFAFLIVFFHRYATAVVADDFIRDLGFTAGQVSLLASLYFYPYAIMQFPTGMLADYVGPRRTTTAGMLLAAVGSLLLSMANSPATAYLGRTLVGIGVAVIFVCALKLQAVWFPSSQFATMSGLTSVVGNIGGILATTPLALLVVYAGWRASFRYIALVSLGVAALIWWIVRDDPAELGFESPNPVRPKPSVRLGTAMKNVLANRYTWPNFFYLFAIMGSTMTISGLWGIPYIMHTYGLERTAASGLVMLMTVGVAIGGPLMGWLADRIGRVKPLMLFSSAGITLIWVYVLYFAGGKPPLELLYPLFFMLGLLGVSFILPFDNAKRVNDPSRSGVAVAVANSGGFVGTAIFNVYVGRLLEQVSAGPVYPLNAYQLAFTSFVVLGVIGVISSLLIAERAPAK